MRFADEIWFGPQFQVVGELHSSIILDDKGGEQ